ncbi:MAG TPA: cation-translocating P-type ATPase [Chitinophagaceae bacterium]|nr:cation-translocating P-type ATPase [Chitinophagaceae bacterium]
MEKVHWKVEGMTCSNCALTISNYLQRQGLKNVKVNPIDGNVSFETGEIPLQEEKLTSGIKALGYQVAGQAIGQDHSHGHEHINFHLRRFLICLPFTLILLLHMIPGLHATAFGHWLFTPWIQLALCVPVYVIGMGFFGRSAVKSLRNGVPNMNVLIALGATAAFVYSLIGTLFNLGEGFLFYETAATIITLVFLGNYMEDASIYSTQKALRKLAKSQRVMANMIAFDEHHQEVIFPIENTQLKNGDLILIKTGEQVPADCKILWGEASVNESIITGESLPVFKKAKDKLIGGSIVEDGTVKAQVTAAGSDTVLSNILQLVEQAQGEKPPMQKMADRISAIFVPVVIGIAAVTLIVNFFVLSNFTESLMRSIAVLVIACPCAMGLATPAAIAVGLGRAARTGILFRNATSLENFKDIKQAVFDKTGTLTTGNFTIDAFKALDIDEEEFKRIAYSLEKYSNHPLAKSIAANWKTQQEIRWKKIEEIKGTGMKAIDQSGNEYQAGSFRIAEPFTKEDNHSIYLVKNNTLLGWIDLKDEVRPEAPSVIRYFRNKGIRTFVLSGDKLEKCKSLAAQLGIDEVIAEQTPEEKLETIAALTDIAPTAMIGDGINDAPALAKATIGISMSDATQVAMQTAHVVLMNNGLKNLPTALGLGKHTYLTIKQNLFWAFIYNIVAIPVAAFGLLTPTFGALVMGLSDVVLAANSVRLFVKKVV